MRRSISGQRKADRSISGRTLIGCLSVVTEMLRCVLSVEK